MDKVEKQEELISLGQFVAQEREKLGLSQSGLAKRCNLPLSQIEEIEGGIDLFLATPIRQKLAKGLKVEPSDIKKHEPKEDFNFAPQGAIELLKEEILEGASNKNLVLRCPKCGEILITRIAKMYDLEDNLVLHPKANCPKCPFQIK